MFNYTLFTLVFASLSVVVAGRHDERSFPHRHILVKRDVSNIHERQQCTAGAYQCAGSQLQGLHRRSLFSQWR